MDKETIEKLKRMFYDFHNSQGDRRHEMSAAILAFVEGYITALSNPTKES